MCPLIAGGSPYARSGALDTTEFYNPKNGKFVAGPKMTQTRAGHTATLLNDGRVLIAGGHGDPSAEIYNPAANSFAATAPMSVSRYAHSATLLPGGKVLIAGGWDADYKPLATTELFDAATGKFTPAANMENARAGHTATLIQVRWPAPWLKPSPSPTPTPTPTPTNRSA